MSIELYKDVAISTLMLVTPFAWVISSGVSAYKEKNRHAEITSAITYFMKQQEDNNAFAIHAVQELSRQKSLIVMRDEDGVLSVRALDTAGKGEVNEALKADRSQ